MIKFARFVLKVVLVIIAVAGAFRVASDVWHLRERVEEMWLVLAILDPLLGACLTVALVTLAYLAWAEDWPAYVKSTLWPSPSPLAARDRENLPDWPIHELFSHIDPDVLDDDPNNNRWEKVGQDIRDALGLRRLKCWGRPLKKGEQISLEDGEWPPPEEIPRDYWKHAGFTYDFFDATRPFGKADTYPGKGSNLPAYFDVRVNSTKATQVWPRKPLIENKAQYRTTLWDVKKRGITIRNARLESEQDVPAWTEMYRKWLLDAYEASGNLSSDLRYDIEDLNETGEPPSNIVVVSPEHALGVRIMSEVLRRIETYLRGSSQYVPR